MLEAILRKLNKDEELSPRIRYGAYIALHKLFVYQEGRKLGLGRARMLRHDWQKLSRAEFGPYCNSFYRYPNHAEWQAIVQADFDRAWLHHQRSGSAHHWQSHILVQDDGSLKPLYMPRDDRLEMIADWRGMGRMFGEEPPAVGWYEKNRDNMTLHPETKARVESELGIRG